MTARVVLLGAGFGGLELTASLSERFGTVIDVTLIDRSDHFVFGFSKLDVMFGTATAAEVSHAYSSIDKPGVRFVRASIRSIDVDRKRVETDAGTFEADFLVIALGADLDAAATPGLAEGGNEFYSNAGAFATREALARFDGGRVVIGITSTPYKCPPAPSETALLVHAFLSDRGLRERSEIAVVAPMPSPVPPVPAVSDALLAALAERGIEWHPQRTIARLDPETGTLVFADDSTMHYDLFLGVPKHVIPPVVAAAGLAPDGWIPTDAQTLQTQYPDVFALGDVAAAGTPKAGVFAEGQAAIVAQEIASRINAGTDSGDAAPAYGGRGICYVGFGQGRAGRVDVTFAAGRTPMGRLDDASEQIEAEKEEYIASRLHRWFGVD